MDLFTYMVLLAFLPITLAEDCVINKVPERMAFEKQLRKDLTCENHKYEPPPGNGSTFSVYIRFILKRFTFNSEAEVMTVQTWMKISWQDERIKWDPDKYYGIKSTNMISAHIWHPDFRLFNSADSYDYDKYFYTWCAVKNTGFVSCMPRKIHNVFCAVKLTHWPYDKQECSFEFGPWTSNRNYPPKNQRFRMDFPARAIQMLGAEYGAEWFISDYRQEANFTSERQLKMIFVLEREAAGLGAIVVYPAVILTALSVTSLFLDVRRFVRLSIACFSVFGHYNFLMELSEHIPQQSSDPPSLLFYYRGSMVLTVLIILSSFLLRFICKLKSTPQNYIISTNDAVFESYGKYFIIPQWNADDDSIDCKRFSQDWTKFANILNCVFTVVIIIAYISMYCALVPQPIPFIVS